MVFLHFVTKQVSLSLSQPNPCHEHSGLPLLVSLAKISVQLKLILVLLYQGSVILFSSLRSNIHVGGGQKTSIIIKNNECKYQ